MQSVLSDTPEAYRSSQYLQSLVDQHAIVPEPSQELDEIYAQYTPASSSPEPSTSTTQHELLLTRDAVPAIVERFELDPSADTDLYRALEQVRLRTGGKAES